MPFSAVGVMPVLNWCLYKRPSENRFSDVWGRYYFDTFIDKAKKGEIFKGNKILNKNSGKIGFDTFRLKLVESNLTLIPFLHDFDEVLG